MKTLIKKPLVALFIITFILSGCSTSTSNLNTEEKNLYDLQEKSAVNMQILTNLLEIQLTDQKTMDYTRIKDVTAETSKYLNDGIKKLEKLKLPEETAKEGENTRIVLESSKRIIDKANEFATDGEELATNTELNDQQKEEEYTQIYKSLSGFKLRLLKSKEKLDNLGAQLVENADKAPSTAS